MKLGGESRGEARGEIKGEAQTLLKLIKLKFGGHPDWVESKLNSADKAQLDRWVEAILTAETWMLYSPANRVKDEIMSVITDPAVI